MKRILYLSLILFLFSSCVKDEIDVNKISPEIEASPSLNIPLAYGTISLDDLLVNTDTLGDMELVIDNENLIHIQYSNVIDSFKISDFLKNVPDQDTSVIFKSGTLGVPHVDYDFSTGEFNSKIRIQEDKSIYYTFKPDEGETFWIDSVTVESGSIRLGINCSFKATGDYYIELPTVISPSGEALRVNFTANDQSTFSPQVVDITGYKILLLDETDTPNKIKVNYGIDILRSSESINDGADIECLVSTEDLMFSEAYGYIGQYSAEIGLETIDLDFLDQFKGDFYLADPTVSLGFENSFGIPMRISLSPDMKAVINDGQDIAFVVNPPNNPKNIAYPAFSEIGTVKTDALTIDNTTSNITELIAAMPDALTFGGKFEINPDADQNIYNFIHKNSYIKTTLDLDLPFDFELKNFSFRDTLEQDLSETISNLEDVEQLELDVNFENGLPLEVKVQLLFYEQKAGTNEIALLPIDSLITDSDGLHIEAGQTSNGVVTSSTSNYVNISVTGERLDKIKDTKFIVIRLFIQTDNPGSGTNYNPVKILSTNEFSYRIGAKGSAKLKLE